MNENTKTISLVAIAAGLILVAVFTRPSLQTTESEGLAGQPLFPDWKDPTAAKSLEVASYDETFHTPRKFSVAEVGGKWVIPSRSNFPANAEDKVVKAASSLINLKIIEQVSNAPGDQETYGVVEPDPSKLDPTATGIGKMVTIRDGSGKDLGRLIIGKADKAPVGSESSNLRFVRRAGRDQIYRVELDTDVFSTKFADWIDSDMLQIKQHWDITKMGLRDYSVDRDNEHRLVVDRKNDIDLKYDDAKGNWSVAKLVDYKDNKPAETKLAGDEELDTAKLNDMKQSLSGVKIVDVEAKPSAFVADLKKREPFFNDPTALESLFGSGFFPLPEQKPTDLFSVGDDMTVQMKDGVEYAIHFGAAGSTFEDKEEAKNKKAGDKQEKKSNVERYVFVTAKFNEDAIPKPELEPLPGEKKPEPGKTDGGKADAGKGDAGKTDAGKNDTGKAAEPKKDAAPDAAKKGDKGSASLNSTRSTGSGQTSSTTATPTASDPPAADKAAPAKADDKAATGKKADDKKADAKAPADAKSGDAKAGEAKPEEKPASGIKQADQEQARDAERKRVEAANKMKTDAYNESIKKGKEHAKQLNDRFAGYYFLISEDDYKKVHLGRNEIIKKNLSAAPKNPFEKPADGGK